MLPIKQIASEQKTFFAMTQGNRHREEAYCADEAICSTFTIHEIASFRFAALAMTGFLLSSSRTHQGEAICLCTSLVKIASLVPRSQ
jgi:hypothetical protein